uniref:Nuclear polyadenylated RNA-binding protein 3 n=1 Tax=Saccharomyces cerevisiae TaxID=4932 RepID=UPI0001E92988|nr:Chain A, Nuclear polyadenylated RNA-binding protein 3 [Saccharomyces cerevisiae]
MTEMHNIPPKSRLFIGNLPLKNVSKEDLFRIFSPYGHIMQINIKNAFGFIQFDNPQSVRDAIECESQEMNFGKKLILEVSSSNARPQFDHGDHGTN